MSDYTDKSQEGLVDYIKNAFNGETVKEENMEFKKEDKFGNQPQSLYFRDVEPNSTFKIVGEPVYRTLQKAGGEPILDKNTGEPAIIWDVPIVIDGEERTLNLYNYKMNILARTVGAKDSKELVDLEYEVKLEKTPKGTYIKNINLLK